MNECERFEIELSATVDGAGDPVASLELLDHLVLCGACREFYRQARTIDALAGAAAPPAAPDEDSWERIATEAGLEPHRRRGGSRVVALTLRLAAVLVAGIGLWAVGALRLPPSLAVRDGMEVRVGEDRGRMSDAQFVEIAVTVLKADRKYRDKMVEILTAVDRSRPAGEDRRDRTLRAVADDGETDPSSGGSRPTATYY